MITGPSQHFRLAFAFIFLLLALSVCNINLSSLFYLKDIPRTMYIYLVGLFLAAFQVACDGAPDRLFPALPADVSEEEKLVEKRARK